MSGRYVRILPISDTTKTKSKENEGIDATEAEIRSGLLLNKF